MTAAILHPGNLIRRDGWPIIGLLSEAQGDATMDGLLLLTGPQLLLYLPALAGIPTTSDHNVVYRSCNGIQQHYYQQHKSTTQSIKIE